MTRSAKYTLSMVAAFLVFLLPSTVVAFVEGSKDELRQVIEWLQVAGKQNSIPTNILQDLDVPTPSGVDDLPTIAKGYKMESGATYHFAVVVVNGRREIIVLRFINQDYQGWRMSEDGTVSKSVNYEAGVTTKRDGLTAQELFLSVYDVFTTKARTAPVNRN